MEIYIIKDGDDINAIAERYGVSVSRLIYDNGLINPYSLVPGQTIVIIHPNQIHTVKEGDTLAGIAKVYGVSIMQLLRNNSFLSDREALHPGETLVISYETSGQVTSNGFAYTYINKDVLKRTLPYLSYLSIFNYGILPGGEIKIYSDDTEMIQISMDYGTIPLLMISTLSLTGEANPAINETILLNEEFQNALINNLLNTLQKTSYYGINLLINDITESNQKNYIDFIKKISSPLKNAGYLFFTTIDLDITKVGNTITFDKIDYNTISQYVYSLTLLDFVWGLKTDPPAPVSSIEYLRALMDYVVSTTNPGNISLGEPLIAYDWELPFIPGETVAVFLTLNSAIALARDQEVTIEFDETSQSPYFYYNHSIAGSPQLHIVWSLDARSINAINDLINQYGLAGSGIWNIMIFYQQLWSLIISRSDIIKLIPDNIG